jgi:hypothetical protein
MDKSNQKPEGKSKNCAPFCAFIIDSEMVFQNFTDNIKTPSQPFHFQVSLVFCSFEIN